MSIDTGSQDRWHKGLPAPIQYNRDDFDLGAQNRWHKGLPSPIQEAQTAAAPPAGVVRVQAWIF
jgi:hypothetical protein